MRVRIGSWAWLSSNELSEASRRWLEKSLTVVPRALHPQAVPQTIYLWETAKSSFGVPRYFFFENAKKDNDLVDETLFAQLETPLVFSGVLKPEQEKARDAVLEWFKSNYGGIAKAPTGFGKTVVALSIVSALNAPTIVFVQRENLVDQWRKEIEKFLPGAKVGKVQGDVCDFRGKDIVIAMMQSITHDAKYPADLWTFPSFLIFDEVHRVSAPTFSRIPPLFPARYRLGVSATPKRKDGTERIFYWHLGPMIYSGTQAWLAPSVKRVWTSFTHPFKQADENKLLKAMIVSADRNRAVVDQIIAALKVGRKIIVFSKRLQHLNILANLLYDLYPVDDQEVLAITDPIERRNAAIVRGLLPSIGFCIGGVRGDDLAEAKKARVLFATYHFAGEAFDVPALDTLVMATPTGDMEQPTGRILRPHPTKATPVVVDFRDDEVSLFKKWGERRDALYARLVRDYEQKRESGFAGADERKSDGRAGSGD